MLASAAPQAGHIATKCSSIPRCRRPAYRNSWAGMTREASTGLALNHAIAPGPDLLRCLTFARSRISLSLKGPTSFGGRASMGSPSRDVTYRSERTRLTCFPSFFLGFLGVDSQRRVLPTLLHPNSRMRSSPEGGIPFPSGLSALLRPSLLRPRHHLRDLSLPPRN